MAYPECQLVPYAWLQIQFWWGMWVNKMHLVQDKKKIQGGEGTCCRKWAGGLACSSDISSWSIRFIVQVFLLALFRASCSDHSTSRALRHLNSPTCSHAPCLSLLLVSDILLCVHMNYSIDHFEAKAKVSRHWLGITFLIRMLVCERRVHRSIWNTGKSTWDVTSLPRRFKNHLFLLGVHAPFLHLAHLLIWVGEKERNMECQTRKSVIVIAG